MAACELGHAFEEGVAGAVEVALQQQHPDLGLNLCLTMYHKLVVYTFAWNIS